jgi:hypothetical protein
MDNILAENVEQFKLLEEGYKQLKENFRIDAETDLIIRNGSSLLEKTGRIDIAPLNHLGEVSEVRKYSSNLRWNLMSSGKGEWRIEGPECNYTIHQKVADILTNLV